MKNNDIIIDWGKQTIIIPKRLGNESMPYGSDEDVIFLGNPGGYKWAVRDAIKFGYIVDYYKKLDAEYQMKNNIDYGLSEDHIIIHKDLIDGLDTYGFDIFNIVDFHHAGNNNYMIKIEKQGKPREYEYGEIVTYRESEAIMLEVEPNEDGKIEIMFTSNGVKLRVNEEDIVKH